MNQAKIFTKQLCRLLLLAGLTVFLTAPGTGLAQSYKAVQSKQPLYAEPNFSANALGTSS